MKAARVSMYGPDLEPITMVLHENELAVPWAEAIRGQKPLPGGYVVVEEFDTERDIIGATMEAVNRHGELLHDEKNAAMLYHYDANLLPQTTEAGVLTMTIPAPLTVETIMDVFEQLSHHPAYRHQLCVGISEDMQFVTMRNGEAKVVSDWRPDGDSA